MAGRAVSRATAGAATAAAAPKTQAAYEALKERLRTLDALGGVSATLSWDELTCLPPGAAEARGRQKAALAEVLHEQRTNPALGELIAAAQEVAGDLGPFEAANIRDAKRNYDRVSPTARSRGRGGGLTQISRSP